jgi:hypothetical protein
MTPVYVVETPAGQFAREGVRGNERGGQRRGDILMERHLRHVRWVVVRAIAGRRCAIRARRPNNGDAVWSVFVGRGVRVGVPRRAAGGGLVLVVGTGAVTGMTLGYSERLGGRVEISRRWRLAWRVLVVAGGVESGRCGGRVLCLTRGSRE